MRNFITAFGILYIIVSAVFFTKPEYVRTVIEFFKVGKRVYIGSVVRIALGVLFIIAAQDALGKRGQAEIIYY